MTFEIFKTGKHTNSNGVEKEFSISDLDNIVETYKPEKREAPIVLGHPKDNAPAFGWIDKIFRKGTSLFAKSKDEDPSFLKAVKDRKFPKRSISLTEDGRLNHIGFLGAVLPAVDGLAPVTFNKDLNYSVYVNDISEALINDNVLENKKVKESVVLNNISQDNSNGESPSKEQNTIPLNENKEYSQPKIDLPLDNSTQNKDNILSQSIVDISSTLEQLKNLTENIYQNFADTNSTELKDTERQKIKSQLENLRMKIDSNNFEVLLNEKLLWGSLTPVMKQKITKTIKFLSNQNFSDFDSDSFVLEIKSQLMDFINSIPKIVDTSDFATKPDSDTTDNSNSENYDGLAIDESSQSLHKQVINKMKDKGVNYLSALKMVMKN